MSIDFSKYGSPIGSNTPIKGTVDMSKYGTPISQGNVDQASLSSGIRKSFGLPDTKEDVASFKASSQDNPLEIAGKTLANIPSSAVNFGKGVIDFLNPLNTVKSVKDLGTALSDTSQPSVSALDVAKEVPKELYKATVPKFLQHIFSGDLQSAAQTIENDPVGQIAPLLMVARGVAEKTGKVAEFDDAMSKVSGLVTKPVEKIVQGAGNIAAQTVGASTGSGASSVKEAFGSASEGKSASTDFTNAMRGKIEPTDIVKSVEDVFQNIKNKRGEEYRSNLSKIGEDTKTHDITPVTSELNTQLKNFGLTDKEGNIKVGEDGKLDFSRSSIANNATARNDIQGVYDTLKDWGTKEGDTTGIGLDLLKKQLGDFYSDSSQARAFVQSIKGRVSKILENEVPGYKDMTSGYSKLSDFLDEVKSATGVGTKARPDTIFTKITTAMKGDKEFRLEILKEMEKVDPTLMNKIAGINMSSWIPRGLVGKGVDVGGAMSILMGHFNPQIIPMLLTTSPRIMGEFVRSLGLAKDISSKVINSINTLKVAGVDVAGILKQASGNEDKKDQQ